MQQIPAINAIRVTMALMLEDRANETDDQWAHHCHEQGIKFHPTSEAKSSREYAQALMQGQRVPKNGLTDGLFARVTQTYRLLPSAKWASLIFVEDNRD